MGTAKELGQFLLFSTVGTNSGNTKMVSSWLEGGSRGYQGDMLRNAFPNAEHWTVRRKEDQHGFKLQHSCFLFIKSGFRLMVRMLCTITWIHFSLPVYSDPNSIFDTAISSTWLCQYIINMLRYTVTMLLGWMSPNVGLFHMQTVIPNHLESQPSNAWISYFPLVCTDCHPRGCLKVWYHFSSLW